jgi:hypothetical protein
MTSARNLAVNFSLLAEEPPLASPGADLEYERQPERRFPTLHTHLVMNERRV